MHTVIYNVNEKEVKLTYQIETSFIINNVAKIYEVHCIDLKTQYTCVTYNDLMNTVWSYTFTEDQQMNCDWEYATLIHLFSSCYSTYTLSVPT